MDGSGRMVIRRRLGRGTSRGLAEGKLLLGLDDFVVGKTLSLSLCCAEMSWFRGRSLAAGQLERMTGRVCRVIGSVVVRGSQVAGAAAAEAAAELHGSSMVSCKIGRLRLVERGDWSLEWIVTGGASAAVRRDWH